jgi:asparagine synthase (glutamine-hydrolysing)
MLDLPRLKKLVDNWPAEGWERSDIAIPYSIELLSAVSVGHFLRRVSGANG